MRVYLFCFLVFFLSSSSLPVLTREGFKPTSKHFLKRHDTHSVLFSVSILQSLSNLQVGIGLAVRIHLLKKDLQEEQINLAPKCKCTSAESSQTRHLNVSSLILLPFFTGCCNMSFGLLYLPTMSSS